MTRQPTPANILADVLTADVATPDRTALRNRLRWDYSQVAPVDRKAVEDAAVDILANGQRAMESASAAGRRLIEAKRILNHGQFGDWIETEFGMTQRMAQMWMNIARTFDGKSEIISLFSETAIALLAAPSTPEPAREQAIQEAQDTGKSPSVQRTKEIIAEHKPLRPDDLGPLVRAWADEYWPGDWPENPSHTNGTFWQKVTAWLRQNSSRPWHEGDLKFAIKQMAAQRRRMQDENNSPFASDMPATTAPRPTLTTAQAADILRPTMDAFYANEDSRRYQVPDMQTGAQLNTGGFWRACERALASYTYTPALLANAIRLLADELTAAQRAPSASSNPAPATVAVDVASVADYTVEQIVEYDADEPAPTGAAFTVPDGRIPAARALITLYREAIATENQYGALTGQFSDWLAPKRELQAMIGHLEHLITIIQRPEEAQ